ncbi:kelch repeat protein [Ancylostoma duodenale]|uniref:Kelch repeat protein n=1 Tax=Ancylostoma duodenale TaxID=51022 RepID=A0A0C2GC70_9BILA|nr:kelch repeat protein [Ancylostoma duodenale]
MTMIIAGTRTFMSYDVWEAPGNGEDHRAPHWDHYCYLLEAQKCIYRFCPTRGTIEFASQSSKASDVEEVKDFHLTGAKRLIPSLLSRPQRCCDFGWAIFVAGGRRNGKLLSGVESYDPVKKRWKHMRPMSLPRVDFGIAVNGNNVYAIGGGIPNLGETGVTVCKMECYDIIKKSWRQLASMREPRSSPSVTFVGDTLYVCGGGNGIILATNNVEIYNPKTNLWQAGVPMLKCRRAAGIAVLNRCVYASAYDDEYCKYKAL